MPVRSPPFIRKKMGNLQESRTVAMIFHHVCNIWFKIISVLPSIHPLLMRIYKDYEERQADDFALQCACTPSSVRERNTIRYVFPFSRNRREIWSRILSGTVYMYMYYTRTSFHKNDKYSYSQVLLLRRHCVGRNRAKIFAECRATWNWLFYVYDRYLQRARGLIPPRVPCAHQR